MLLLLAGVVSFVLSYRVQSDLLGATLNYSNSLSNISLYNSVESLLADITALQVRTGSSTAVTLNLPSIGISPSSTVTSTAFSGAESGDLFDVSIATTSVEARELGLHAYGCGANLVCLVVFNASSSAINLGSSASFQFTQKKFISGARPVLQSTTSTSN